VLNELAVVIPVIEGLVVKLVIAEKLPPDVADATNEKLTDPPPVTVPTWRKALTLRTIPMLIPFPVLTEAVEPELIVVILAQLRP
jgi:hypothetical protein